MRADKATISHSLSIVVDSVRKKYGDDFVIELHGDGKVRLVVKDLVNHDHSPKSLDDLVNHAVDKITKDDKNKDVQSILAEYPRKRDLGAARSAILKALRDEEIPCAQCDRAEFLRVATRLYRRWCEINRKEMEWIPYPQTFFNRKSYLNAPGAVLGIMQQMKRGEVPKVKTSMFPSSWNENR